MRYFLELSYCGANYNGWQRQTNAPTVQQTLEEALSVLLHKPTEIVGAGRTDTGVHANHYVAHLDIEASVESEDFCYHLNAILPEDIAVHTMRRVRDDAHARFDAVSRQYQYHILNHKDPFRRHTTWQNYTRLDIEAMNEAAAMLLDHSDFTTFSKLHSNNKTTICRVINSFWSHADGEMIYTITADRFLRNMVRSLVGTLFDVGRGKISVDNFSSILKSCNRARASGSAPSQGLFLTEITYNDNIFIKSL